MTAIVLTIAGSDSGGGAGIQGDSKTITALGGYAATAVTALTAQNTQGVFGIHPVPESFIAQQIRLVLEDMGAGAIKTGMLHTSSAIEIIVDVLADYPDIPLIVDTVMIAKGGVPLLQDEAVATLMTRLIPKALLITPNVPEAELLLEKMGCKLQIRGCREMEEAGRRLLGLGCNAVLVKGGHLEGSGQVTDILVTSQERSGIRHYASPRLATRHTHGTGCTLASAIATGIAQQLPLEAAIARAHAYVHEAIRTAPGVGKGKGPINHGHTVYFLRSRKAETKKID